MAVEPIDLPTGIDVTATIADDGTGCIMTLDGADEALRQLPDEIPADVSITTRG
jgi:hypothetical protein